MMWMISCNEVLYLMNAAENEIAYHINWNHLEYTVEKYFAIDSSSDVHESGAPLCGSSVLFNVQHNKDRDSAVPNLFITRYASVLPNR